MRTKELITDVRTLLGVGVLCAMAATAVRENDRAFGLWSNISSLCTGAAIGILQESNDKKKDHDRY